MTAPDPSGRSGGLARWLQRAWLHRRPSAFALLPLAALYGAGLACRALLARLGVSPPVRLRVPVVVVGNLIAGGAGKTPTVIAVVALLKRHGFTPGIVSRGYGRRDDARLRDVEPDADAAEVGDEPLLLRLRTGAPVCVARDRVAAGRRLLERHPTIDVVVADDGLQHRRLARDAQVIVFDERGAGNGWLQPAGPLREPLPRRVPPRSLVVYNAIAATTALPGTVVRRSLNGVVPLAEWRRGVPTAPVPIAALRGRPIVAAAGVAHPRRFFDMLAANGLAFTRLPLADHFDYAALPWPADTPDVVTTEKDAVKLEPQRIGATRVWVAALDFELAAAFENDLIRRLHESLRERRLAAPFPADHGNPSS